jgi:iduronate 2-sulfatase
LYRPSKQSKVHWYDRENSWRAVDTRDRINDPLPDDLVAERAVKTLRQLGSNRHERQPFFMAVGFYKPHLPFVFPSQYLSLYPTEQIDLPRPATAPNNTGIPSLARTRWEINKYSDIAALNITSSDNESTSSRPLPDNVTRELRRAYYCSVSYVDDLVGRILWELDAQGLADNTIIAFLGDHGWHLGESNLWGKHTNFELSTRAPLMIRVPGLTDSGLVYDRPVEFVDLFPTLVEAAGFDPLPVCPADTEQSWRIPLCTEGASLMPLMRRSAAAGGSDQRPIKQVAFSQYPRRGFSVMGYSVRTARYRYTEWAQRRSASRQSPRWRVVHAVELYDHKTDPDETINVADSPAYSQRRAALELMLAGGWRAALFPNETVSIEGTVSHRRSGHTRIIPRLRLVTLRPARRTSVEPTTLRPTTAFSRQRTTNRKRGSN